MKEMLTKYIRENNLSPFNQYKTQIESTTNSIYKTKDAKLVHNHVLQKVSQHFVFSETSNLFNAIPFTNSSEEIKERQEFFRKIKAMGRKENNFLNKLKNPRPTWKPPYDVVVVTEDSNIFNKLREENCPVQMIISENDLALLETKDLVQVLNCNEYGLILESLPQAVFLKNISEAYLERNLEKLSAWRENIQILKQYELSQSLGQTISEIEKLLPLIGDKKTGIITRDFVEQKTEEINRNISSRIKEMTISGDTLFAMMNKGVLPPQLKSVVREEIIRSGIPFEVFIEELPVKIFEEELEKTIARQSSNEFSNIAEEIKNYSKELKEIPEKLKQLSENILIFDFFTGISKFIEAETIFPEYGNEFIMEDSKNIFLDNPQPISFMLSPEYKCSILTGANSGGKTTLIEHIIQLLSLYQLGLPVSGKIRTPLFTEVYYFAKNKGSANKGAFETLLTQMAKITPGDRTLVLADEIESVTEPGVAGKIIAATAEYYISKNCYLVIATHLGQEIQKTLPAKTRIDGIEAKGLTPEFELIVDHNPVLGRLAHSTPELIVEKMANSQNNHYFTHLNNFLKARKL